MAQSGRQQLSPFDVLTTYTPSNATDAPAEVGATAGTPDGRTFKLGFVAAGATALSASKLTMGPVVLSALQGATCSTQSIGDTQITLTFSSTTLTANQLAGGFIGIITGTGSVQTLQIKSHPAVAATTTCVFTLVDPIYIATSGSPTANVWDAPYSAIVVASTTITASVTGIPIVAVSPDATYGTYAWFQTGGVALALNQGNTTAALGLAPSSSVAGALATVGATTNQVATASQAGTDAAYGFVDLNIFS